MYTLCCLYSLLKCKLRRTQLFDSPFLPPRLHNRASKIVGFCLLCFVGCWKSNTEPCTSRQELYLKHLLHEWYLCLDLLTKKTQWTVHFTSSASLNLTDSRLETTGKKPSICTEHIWPFLSVLSKQHSLITN